GPAEELLVGLVRTEEPVKPVKPADPAVYRAAQSYRGTKILVSTNERRLRLIAGRDTLRDVPGGIGMGADLEYEDRAARSGPPPARRQVLRKPGAAGGARRAWHYMEEAPDRGLELVRLKDGDELELEDGSHLGVRDGEVGRVNHFGNFWAFPPGMEII